MKKLLIALLIVLSFTACTQTEEINSQPNQQSEIINVENTENSLEELQRNVHEITISDIIGREKLKSLEAVGISVAIKNCEVISDTEAEAVIEFTKDDYSFSVDTVLDIYYMGSSDKPQNLHLGGINTTVDGHQLIITYPFGIERYSVETLEYIDTIKVFSDYFKIIDTAKHGIDYIAVYTDGRTVNLLRFNKDGQVETRYPLEKELSSIVLKTGGNYNQKYAVAPLASLMMLNGNFVLFTSDNTMVEGKSFIYTLSENKGYISYQQVYIKDSCGEFYILGNYNQYRNSSAFVMKDGQAVSYMYVPDQVLMDGKWGKNGVTTKEWDENSEKITLVCNSTGNEIVFDFKNEKVWSNASKAVIENNLQQKISDSPDGKYSLWWADGGSGGDVMVMDLYLIENESDKIKYIDTIGGMYGGNAGCGFFSNGDIYTIMLDEFKVFTTDMSQQGPVFEMSKNFPLGDDAIGDDTYRRLLSARRDPATHSWAVLYHEGKYHEIYEDNYVDYDKWSDNFFNSTYKIGILDPQGNLTKTYETGEHVMTYPFRQTKMHMETGDILHFSVLHKGVTPQLEAKIDLKTGEYTCISGGYNSWKK